MTQYERDFERVSGTVRKEVIRFEVRCSLLLLPLDVGGRQVENVITVIPLTERKGQEFQKTDYGISGVFASVSATGEFLCSLT